MTASSLNYSRHFPLQETKCRVDAEARRAFALEMTRREPSQREIAEDPLGFTCDLAMGLGWLRFPTASRLAKARAKEALNFGAS